MSIYSIYFIYRCRYCAAHTIHNVVGHPEKTYILLKCYESRSGEKTPKYRNEGTKKEEEERSKIVIKALYGILSAIKK